MHLRADLYCLCTSWCGPYRFLFTDQVHFIIRIKLYALNYANYIMRITLYALHYYTHYIICITYYTHYIIRISSLYALHYYIRITLNTLHLPLPNIHHALSRYNWVFRVRRRPAGTIESAFDIKYKNTSIVKNAYEPVLETSIFQVQDTANVCHILLPYFYNPVFFPCLILTFFSVCTTCVNSCS